MNVSAWSLALAGVENFVLACAALSILSFIAASAIRASKRSRTWHPLRLSRVYAAALVMPPLVSAWLVIASLLPVLWLGSNRWASEHENAHTNHLLNAFTVRLDPALSYAAIVFVLIAVMVAAYAAASGYFRIGRIVRRLEIVAEPAAPGRIMQVEAACRRYGISVGLVVSRYPFSFVWGYLRSKLVVSTGLLNALTSEEIAALLEHEAAHHTRRDNLSKWLLTVCRYASPVFPLTRLLYRWWSEQVEMVCDEVAARRASSPVEVASAMVRLKRLTLRGLPGEAQPSRSGFLGEQSDGFERRVTRLLSLADQPQMEQVIGLSRSWARAAAMFGAAFALTLATLFAVSPLAIHRVIELLLHGF